MITTPSMGLKRWDQPNDVFSYTELSDNWALVDGHDHTTGKGVQIPTAGIANLAVTGTKLANDAVDASKVLNASLGDTELASPNNTLWKPILYAQGAHGAGWAPGAYAFLSSAALNVQSGTLTTVPILALPWTATDYAVSGKLTKMRISAAFITNTVSPSGSVTIEMREVTGTGGAASNISYTLGAAVTGSSLTQALTASNRIRAATAEFTPPADGIYTITAGPNVVTAANSFITLGASIQIRHV